MRTFVKRLVWFWMLATYLPTLNAWGQQGNVVRLVTWQAKPGMDRDLEEGYRRHLEWHRANHDPWSWYGWTIISGDHGGYFVDGTFFHSWADFDSPVNPAGDATNNDLNVFPYGEVRSLGTFEILPGISNLKPEQLSSKLLTFCRITIAPGHERAFEELAETSLQQAKPGSVNYALLRPVNGTQEYLLLLTAQKVADFPAQAAMVARLVSDVTQGRGGAPIIQQYKTETGRFRQELSYRSEER